MRTHHQIKPLKSIRQVPLLFICLFSVFTSPVYASLPFAMNGQNLPSLAPMLEQVTPAVVNISTSRFIKPRDNPLMSDPLLRYLFNLPQSQPQQPKEQKNSLGSGVVIDAQQGYVVTNHHVIDMSDSITVTLRDGRALQATLLGSDPETDIALLQIPAENLRALKYADSEKLRVGDFAVAIGNPFGLGQTVTSGIISALGRTGLGIEGYEDFIQTDASINPGNSGGALVNLNGELIGINTAILAPGGSGGNVGIGFAIPMNMVQSIVEHLRDYGEVKRGILGVLAQDITPELAQAFNLKQTKGAVVVQLDPHSAAQKAGLKLGDIIIALNDKSVDNSSDVRIRIGLLRIGDYANLQILRKGRHLTIRAVVEDIPGVEGQQVSPYFDGARLHNLRVETRQGETQRVFIQRIKEDSPAWQVGLRAEDMIVSINRVRITSIAELADILPQIQNRLYIRLLRHSTLLTLRIR